ncbi:MULTISPECIES: hypothetical protein [Lacticaseibacillus]|jgi:hypothetical protein|uniref:hypothetical protein n=1 Tax=Lacticaseibacillus TaxID=2759736 RepID=UPI000B318C0D|nr:MULTISPECIES: hypothetical protein [Lacticaseibacillus]MDN5580895.1 hypothetical protein [Lactococcus raffinolactis]MDN6022465.1 hypothetical protein [Lactobacillus sp.]MBM6408917.1 hypothetical protein [Lacticaseibacillus rhamnosus]MBM6411318.1 hypothetical protein [Lacticaseibacillus paracasei]MBM6453041.1 hypothetical protein [Lacticaseibacillus paracasei]
MQQFTSLSVEELSKVSGGSSGVWYGIGKELGIIWAAAGDAGYDRAHKYGGKTKY